MKGWARVAAKDLRAEARSREGILPLLLTALLVLAVGALAYHDVHDPAPVAAGILWTSLAFAAATGLARAFGAERDRGTLDTLLALPVERSSVYLGKAASSFVTLLLVALVVAPACLWIAGAPPRAAPLALLVVLGCAGLAATGTLLSLLAAQARGRDLLLPVLLFPLVVPVLIAATHGTLDVLSGAGFDAWRPELMLLAGYDLTFVAVCAALFEQAL